MSEIVNLLQETIDDLVSHLKTEKDVLWVGTSDGSRCVSWDEFATFAGQVNYDSGYGTNYIPLELVIVGADWWMERGEYDGSEWWEFKCIPKRQDSPLDTLQFISERISYVESF